MRNPPALHYSINCEHAVKIFYAKTINDGT